MAANLSLRARLTVIILTPLVVISWLVGVWAVVDAQNRADDRFDRALLSAALAVSRDVAVSGGDALSPETNALLRDSFSGPVFYHVFAPDGAFLTGYATPPVPVGAAPVDARGQQVFVGIHQSREVVALRFVDTMQVEGWSGDYTITVWQDLSFRRALVRDLVRSSLLVISLLVATVALVVWFGVRFGLRPLNDLEDAIARRSTDELDPIQRNVPEEVTGIVNTLNSLFRALSQNMAAQADFISNAAHQLRNPIAGVLALAEATSNAPNGAEAKQRTADLLQAARETSDLSQKLLLMERAKAFTPARLRADVDLSNLLRAVVDNVATSADDTVRVDADIAPGLRVKGDETMILEAVTNLLENALIHCGPTLRQVTLTASEAHREIRIEVTDDGKGIPPDDHDRALTRFEQLGSSSGSGLGLSIVDAVARAHGGTCALRSQERGLSARMTLAKG
ncbi:MAG: sensor histidine kinase [Pseudomonadota bacterium]